MKEDVLESLYNLFEGRERVLNAFDSKNLQERLKVRVFQAKSQIILGSKY